MGLFSRSPGITVSVSPESATPRQLLTATVTTERPVDKVTSATLQWGYTNFYRYHWAGRADSAAAAGNDSIWHTGVGTNAGGDRDSDEWVSVTEVALATPGGELQTASSTFRVPSWAPGSSPQIAKWGVRLIVERDGRDIDSRADFTVRIGRANVTAEEQPMASFMGAAETIIDIALPAPVFTAGAPITGTVTLTPTMDLPDGDLAVCWQQHRESHPLTRSASPPTSSAGPIVKLGKGIALHSGSPVVIPFEIPLPDDAPPTASAVHSSLHWSVQARLLYAGFNGHMPERVLRPIVVVNAP